MNGLAIPLAYRYVALALMLAEINFCTKHLQLAGTPVNVDSLRLTHVSNPFVTGFGGTIETREFSFVFFKSGVLRRIVRINRFQRDIPLRELQWRQSRMKSLVNTNDAYQLATNWLSLISVDVLALENKHRHSVEQTFFYPDASDVNDPPEKKKRFVLLPIFLVKWGDPDDPVVRVSIFGPTKELLSIHQEDDSFSRRPHELLKDRDKLLLINDDEFLKYTEEQRNQLVRRFAAADYGTNYAFPIVPLHLLQQRTPNVPGFAPPSRSHSTHPASEK
jgi:hypothetical protein